MAVSKELKNKVQSEISGLLVKYGNDVDFSVLYKKYTDQVPQSTFYRWTKAIHASGVPAQKAIRTAKKRANRKSAKKKTATKKYLARAAAAEVVEALPLAPDASIITGLTLNQMSEKLSTCMNELESLMAHAKNSEGKIRNARLLMQAIEGTRRTIDSSTRLMEMLWDIRRTEQFHKAIFNRLKERDPAFVELILTDLRQINKDWGIQV